MTPLAIWQAVRAVAKHWKWALIAFLVLYAAVQKAESRHWHKKADNAVKALNVQAAAYTAAQNAAHARAEAEKAATEQHYAKVAEDTANAYQAKFADLTANARRYASLHPATAQSGSGRADLSGASEAAASTAPESRAAIVPAIDLERCAKAVTTAEGWQDWWQRVSDPAAR